MISDKTARRILRQFTKRFQLKYRFKSLGRDFGAQTNCNDGLIVINSDVMGWTRDRIISFAIHEAVHIWAWRHGVFRVYHSRKAPDYMTVKELRIYLQTAWRAECWVEQKARKLMKEHFPNSIYWFAYNPSQKIHRARNKKWFDETELTEYRKMYRKKMLRQIDRIVLVD